VSYPVYGRYQASEPPSALTALHVPTGRALKPVSHESPLAILDQSDLNAQHIRCSQFIPGCHSDPDALGSCTANATVAWLAFALEQHEWVEQCRRFVHGEAGPVNYADSTGAERAAIGFYHACTSQTADPAQEWPPTDCGSSGPYIVQELERAGIASGARIAHDPTGLCSLLQDGPVLLGSPFLLAWEEPHGPSAIVDGNGSPASLQDQIRFGIAGGHETLIEGIDTISLTDAGTVNPEHTILVVRNSWSSTWGDHGRFRIHLSTLAMLGSYCDYRQPTLRQ
jgi:hypothetical protein